MRIQHTTAMPGAQPVACPQPAPAIDLTPFLTVAGRLLLLLSQRTHGTVPSNRQLAAALGCSAGALPRAWRELEDVGYVTRDADGVITILIAGDQWIDQRDQEVDQCDQSVDQRDQNIDQRDQNIDQRDQNIDHSVTIADRVLLPDAREMAVGADQSADQRDQNIDPPHTPHNGTLASSSSSCARTLENDLVAAGVAASLARMIADRCPDRTIAQFQAQIALARSRGKRSPIGLIATLWSDGRMLQPDEEAPDDGRSDVSQNHGRRSAAARPDQRAGRGPAEPGVIRDFLTMRW